MTTFESAMNLAQEEHNRLIERNRFLADENDRLRSEQYKDSELANLKSENEKLWRRVHHYGLDDEDYQECMDWWHEHIQKSHSADVRADRLGNTKKSHIPSYTFEIDEFAECTCYSIVCNGCKEMHNIYY